MYHDSISIFSVYSRRATVLKKCDNRYYQYQLISLLSALTQICNHTESWLLVDVVFKMHHNTTSSFLVKSMSSSNANVAAGTCNNLKNVTVKMYGILSLFYCDLCISYCIIMISCHFEKCVASITCKINILQ